MSPPVVNLLLVLMLSCQTHIGTSSGRQLRNFRIGVYDVSPAVTAPTVDSIRVCFAQDVPVDSTETRSFSCDGRGRYVVIIALGEDRVLSLCEVQIFGRLPAGTYYQRTYCKENVCIVINLTTSSC